MNPNIFLNHPHPRILCHVCCGPCSIMPLKALLGQDAEVWGYFYNPNIHPLSEFRKRLDAVKTLSGLISVKMLYNEEYKAVEFVREMKDSLRDKALVPKGAVETVDGEKRVTNSGENASGGVKFPAHGARCAYCYSVRLEATAKAAKEAGFDAFTSSLLYSRYQAHDEIRSAGIEIGGRVGVPFYYADFRGAWQAGIDESKAFGLYRQKYCGCIYSRIERYAKKKGGNIMGRS